MSPFSCQIPDPPRSRQRSASEARGHGSWGRMELEVDELVDLMRSIQTNSKETGRSSTPSSTSDEPNQHQRSVPLMPDPEGVRGDATTSKTMEKSHDRGITSSGPDSHRPDDVLNASDSTFAAVTAARPTLTSPT